MRTQKQSQWKWNWSTWLLKLCESTKYNRILIFFFQCFLGFVDGFIQLLYSQSFVSRYRRRRRRLLQCHHRSTTYRFKCQRDYTFFHANIFILFFILVAFYANLHHAHTQRKRWATSDEHIVYHPTIFASFFGIFLLTVFNGKKSSNRNFTFYNFVFKLFSLFYRFVFTLCNFAVIFVSFLHTSWAYVKLRLLQRSFSVWRRWQMQLLVLTACWLSIASPIMEFRSCV